MSGPKSLAAFWIVAVVALAASIVPTADASDDEVYPADITPPPGTQYPCALTALPRTLTGVPESERGYINRVYGLVIRGIHAKLLVLKAVEARGPGGSMDDVWRFAEGRQASGRLIAAWGRMQARYPQWSRETSDSVYHQLCALDLF